MAATEAFSEPSASNHWYFAGLASSFPDITPSKTSSPSKVSELLPCPLNDDSTRVPACKILQTSSTPTQVLAPLDAEATVGFEEQVMVFQYRGKFHAVDHTCPHRSYPLSRGSLHDIEDFGIVLSASLKCPKHGWAFDVFTGESDTGRYRLNVWQVELRQQAGQLGVDEVWVRKKQRPRIG